MSTPTIESEAEAPEIGPEDLSLEVPWHGVLVVEDARSGDNRQFAADSLTWRDVPLPLKWMERDEERHNGSVVVGKITRIWREGNLIKAEGVFDTSPYGYEAVRLIATEMIRGVSIDADSAEAFAGDDEDDLLTFSSARISAATLCPIPAFAEAFVALGPWEDDGQEHEEVGEDGEPTDSEIDQLNRDLGPEGAQVVQAAISEADWDGSAGRFTPEQWHASCIVHLHEGDGAPEDKSECKVPIREPNGDLSRAAVHAAASRIDQTEAPEEEISKAKAALRSAYSELDEEPPEGIAAAAEDNAPGRLKDGSAPQCKFCENTSTGYVLWAEGKAFVPFCAEHEQDAKDAIDDPEDINKIGEYATGTETFAPVPRKTKDGPGWITDPKPTKRITDYWVDGPGAALIGWGTPGDFNRCRTNLAKYVQNPEWLAGLCANLHYRALRSWPGQRHSAETMEANMTEGLVASVTLADTKTDALPAEWFEQPDLDGPTPFTVSDTGRCFGHIATWDTCHIGIGDACVTAPHSAADYAYFLTGEVETTNGPLPVGVISLGGGHADLSLGMQPTLAHYDSTSTAAAYVMVGEDEFGIWCAGSVRPGLEAEKVQELRAAALSGDWRRVGGNLEMVATLAVNVPGFPIPRPSMSASGGQQNALVAAAIPAREAAEDSDAIPSKAMVAAVKQAMIELAQEQRRADKAREIKANVRRQRAAALKSTLKV